MNLGFFTDQKSTNQMSEHSRKLKTLNTTRENNPLPYSFSSTTGLITKKALLPLCKIFSFKTTVCLHFHGINLGQSPCDHTISDITIKKVIMIWIQVIILCNDHTMHSLESHLWQTESQWVKNYKSQWLLLLLLLLLHPFYSSLDFVRDYQGELVLEPIWILLKQETIFIVWLAHVKQKQIWLHI